MSRSLTDTSITGFLQIGGPLASGLRSSFLVIAGKSSLQQRCCSQKGYLQAGCNEVQKCRLFQGWQFLIAHGTSIN